MAQPTFRALFHFFLCRLRGINPAVAAAKRTSKQIESLRNSLAHGQGFVDQFKPDYLLPDGEPNQF